MAPVCWKPASETWARVNALESETGNVKNRQSQTAKHAFPNKTTAVPSPNTFFALLQCFHYKNLPLGPVGGMLLTTFGLIRMDVCSNKLLKNVNVPQLIFQHFFYSIVCIWDSSMCFHVAVIYSFPILKTALNGNCNVLIHTAVVAHVGCFQFGLIMNNGVMHLHRHVFVHLYMPLLAIELRVEVLGHRVCPC